MNFEKVDRSVADKDPNARRAAHCMFWSRTEKKTIRDTPVKEIDLSSFFFCLESQLEICAD